MMSVRWGRHLVFPLVPPINLPLKLLLLPARVVVSRVTATAGELAPTEAPPVGAFFFT